MTLFPTLADFRDSLTGPDPVAALRAGLIGEGRMIPGPRGEVALVYADFIASGRALAPVEDFIRDHVLPFYANTHTEASFTGARTTALREQARGHIARLIGAGEDHAVIFAGAGATAGLNKLVSLLGVNEAARPVVFVGPYEHHSNLLPWRESRARVVEIPEAGSGGPDLAALEAALREHAGADLMIGAFSAASNVTGIITDPGPVSDLLHAHGALAVWDYAGGGPYLPIDMAAAAMDALVVSPHKFAGGPGASGVLAVRRDAVRLERPSQPGGGTVAFVSPWRHDYLSDLIAREEAGTPNILGDIRAGLAFLVKEAVGTDAIHARDEEYRLMAEAAWADHPNLTILGLGHLPRLPFFSLLVRGADGAPVPPALFTTMLSDLYGIQARGGCACAGPYGHRLLGIDRPRSEAIRGEIMRGEMIHKPGWVRLNLSWLMDRATVTHILASVAELAENVDREAAHYRWDAARGVFARHG